MSEQATREEAVKKLWAMIKDIKVAMMSTVDQEGALRSRPMAADLKEFDGHLWFFTRADSGKVGEIRRREQVNLSFAEPKDQNYVSVSGPAELVRDKDKAAELWSPVLKAWFPKGLDDPELALLRVDVEKAEYWDSPSSTMVYLVGLAKAIVTGHPYKPGENEKVDLQPHAHGR